MGHRLLIVDDSALTRAFIRRTVSLCGYATEAILEAADGRAGLAAMRASPVDLVVADLHMPVMDGSEMYEHMRADPALARIPVLVVSAEPNAAHREELREAGIAGYISKPFTPEALRGALSEIWGVNHA